MVTDATDATFRGLVLGGPLPTLVDFWAEWCMPCRLLNPVLAELADELEDTLRIVKVDVDKCPEVAAMCEVTSLPRMTLYVDGEIVRSISGLRSRSQLLAELGPFLGIVRSRVQVTAREYPDSGTPSPVG